MNTVKLDHDLWAQPPAGTVISHEPLPSDPPHLEYSNTEWSVMFISASGAIIDTVCRYGQNVFKMPLGGAKGWAAMHLDKHFKQWPRGRLVICNHQTYESWTRTKAGKWRQA